MSVTSTRANDGPQVARRTSPNDIQVISRMADVLGLFTTSEPVHSLSSVAARSGLPMSSCHRLVTSLVRASMLAPGAEPGSYELGHEARRLGQVAAAQVRVGEAVYRMLRRLNQELDENTALSIYSEGHAVVLERVESNPIRGSAAGVGQRMRLNQTASGQVLLAYLNSNPAATKAANRGDAATRPTSDLRIERIRNAGYAIGAGFGQGEITLAVPVINNKQCLGALGISGSPERIHFHSTGQGLERMRVAARAIALRPELIRAVMGD